MCATLEKVGLEVERAHHEVGTAGQQEINYRFNTLLHAADDLMKFKYVIRNEAFEAGKSVTFMPKPIFGDNGSGMHSHQSCGRTASRCSSTRRATAVSPTSRAGTSAACSSTRRRCSPSPTRR